MKTLLQDALNNVDPSALPYDNSVGKTKQISWINSVISTFLSEAKPKDSIFRWRGTSTGASFSIYYDQNNQAFITLPRSMLSLMAAAFGQTNNTNTPPSPSFNVRFSNAQINGPWFEFANGGYGVGDQAFGYGMLDWGDGWTTFQDFPAGEPSYLRVVMEQTESSSPSPLSIFFQGVDQNGNDIYTGTGTNTIKGVNLVFGGIVPPSYAQTSQIFGAPPSIVQKPVTYGPLSLYAVGATTGTVTLISIYDPGDTSPGFRRYKLGNMQQNQGQGQSIPFTTLHSMVKRRAVPAVAMTDELIPGNIQALELGLQGRRYDLQSEPDLAHKFWSDAFGILNAEVAEYRGAAVPRIIFQKGTNIGGMPFIN